jgi:hypothetical protein
VVFESPLAKAVGAEAFVEEIQRDIFALKEIQVKKIMAEGNQVCAMYELKSRDPRIGGLVMTDWFTFEGDKILTVQSNYDSNPVSESLTQI